MEKDSSNIMKKLENELQVRVDYFDLLISAFNEHEKNLDRLITKIEHPRYSIRVMGKS